MLTHHPLSNGASSENKSSLNPDLIPVVAMDLPLYAMAKELQWSFAKEHGERKYVVMLGGLTLRWLGDTLNGNCWISLLEAAGIKRPGVAYSFITAGHVTKKSRQSDCCFCFLHSAA